MVKQFGTVRCNECDQDLTQKTQVYDYKDTAKTIRVVYCEQCNWRLGKIGQSKRK